jgi:hypothetical protein
MIGTTPVDTTNQENLSSIDMFSIDIHSRLVYDTPREQCEIKHRGRG